MKIKNFDKLATTDMRRDAMQIIKTGLEKADPHSLMRASVKYNDDFNSITVHTKTFDLLKGRIFVVGGGKAGGHMAESLEEIIGSDNITAGVINSKSKNYKTDKIKIIAASHPLPDKNGVKGVEQMLELKEKYSIGEKDLVVCLISGGGSALLPSPVEDISLKDKQEVTELLIKSGASIYEINSVRKHLSKIKGGRLSQYFSPATVVSLVISDVVGNSLETIASGPTVPDPTTFNDALSVLKKYNLTTDSPSAVIKYLERGCEGDAQENPKELDNTYNYFIGDKAYVLEAMSHQAKKLGYKPLIVSTELIGGPKPAAEACVEELFAKGSKKYTAFFFGGELTFGLPQKYGKGGRNQHFAALALKNPELEAQGKEWVMASFATDGVDYTPEVCGAIVDENTYGIAQAKKIDVEKYIENFDTYTLFKKIGDSQIKTGDTGTNVGDLVFFLLKR